MTRIHKLFERKKKNILNVYCTAGFPRLDSTLSVVKALAMGNTDIIEIGIPYSDPLADGPVIQASGSRALENGMTIAELFFQLKNLRAEVQVPVILMGYMNTLLQFGFEKFCASASRIGIDGLIIPDLPIYEFDSVYGPVIKQFGLDFIFLVTPETSPERVRKLDELSSGFLYAVSSSSTTGNDKNLVAQTPYFKRLQDMHLKNPVLIGFGIRDKESFDTACSYAQGAIIGSAYINSLGKTDKIETATKDFLDSILN
jgi:tryptophan synthase alpha chain